MRENYKKYLLKIKDLPKSERLIRLKRYCRKLIKIFNKKFDELFEITHYLAVKDSKYDDIYNDDTIEDAFQDIEMEDFDTIGKCKEIIEQLINILEKLDEEINYCKELQEKELKIPRKIDMDIVEEFDGFVPLLAQKSFYELKEEQRKTPKDNEMYVLYERAINYKKKHEKPKFSIFGALLSSLFDSKSNNKKNDTTNDYEPYNFEEEELEEDDFYYEDLD